MPDNTSSIEVSTASASGDVTHGIFRAARNCADDGARLAGLMDVDTDMGSSIRGSPEPGESRRARRPRRSGAPGTTTTRENAGARPSDDLYVTSWTYESPVSKREPGTTISRVAGSKLPPASFGVIGVVR